ncbi:hypothetical protein ODZ84_11250 [Chryseobacterium fluminis]|uniref:hypothetical protein n=1 Tax=Chryseobacterium fluminis TaxID=2983606 RepID=UPI00224FCFBA|nr:hypothetical protein [Chryseobacterium sp. MMS21-Ot14]UZU00101.1 hypothetical protein ODZ84_11250 [Chryseobacterium sp. MMS21-Ot14]
MKKTRTPQFSAAGKKHSALQQMETYFQFHDLTNSKNRLNNIVNYAVKKNSWIKEEPSDLFHFRQSMKSLVRAGYRITLKENKWEADDKKENATPLLLGSLSEKEYRNPLLVFKKAFSEYSVREFDYFMSGMIYSSLGVYDSVPEKNIVSPYIHLTKMLDAAHLILERRSRK